MRRWPWIVGALLACGEKIPESGTGTETGAGTTMSAPAASDSTTVDSTTTSETGTGTATTDDEPGAPDCADVTTKEECNAIVLDPYLNEGCGWYEVYRFLAQSCSPPEGRCLPVYYVGDGCGPSGLCGGGYRRLYRRVAEDGVVESMEADRDVYCGHEPIGWSGCYEIADGPACFCPCT